MIICSCLEASTIFYNIVVAISILAGAGWTLFIFTKRHEEVGIDLKIDRIDLISFDNGKEKYLDINVTIRNIGKRDVNLELINANVKVSKAEKDGQLVDIIDHKTGVISTEPRYNGRLRSNVETKLPYWLKIQNDGLHFIEFSIPIDLCMYDKSIFKKDGIINWTDKRFYFVKE